MATEVTSITGAALGPVYERGWQVTPDEVPQLYDIYIDGKWIGSRRTVKQCEEAVRNAR